MEQAAQNEQQQQASPKGKASKSKAALAALDYLAQTANKIENLTKEQAVAAATTNIEYAGTTDFELGGVLSKIQAEGWFDPYENFRKMVEDKLGLEYRKAMYLIGIYRHLIDQQIPWETVGNLGWTKIRVLITLPITPENVDEWAEKAKHLTVEQLREQVKAANTATPAGEADKAQPTSDVVNKTFKLHGDQQETINTALDKAKAELHTEFDTVALEGICTQYLTGGAPVAQAQQAVSLIDLMKQHTAEEVLTAFEQVFPTINLLVSEEVPAATPVAAE